MDHPALVYHAPTPQHVVTITELRAVLSAAITHIQETVPECAERTLAIRKIEEAAMWANKAIVFDGTRYL